MDRFDVIIVGGGHAGAEAARIAARLGARTLLLTQRLDTIGQMSCNPAIGGIAKGTVVREVDALGGLMARATDRASVHFRMLNRSKGPAVWSPRAQCDRVLYRQAVRALLEDEPNLTLREGLAVRLAVSGGRVTGIETEGGRSYVAAAVVLTAGTFLRGRIHVGTDVRIAAGRAGEAPADAISQTLIEHGLTIERFKTGTPPRIAGESVDLGRLARQESEATPYWFSYHEQAPTLPRLTCYLTWAGAEVRAVIEQHLDQSALYGGAISSRGPRYCPSIEDKVVKFADAERHQVFLEPEGLGTEEMYVNGLSTSLPEAVQLEMLRAVPGLEQVVMTKAGYAIEYDYFPPTQLLPTLETRSIAGLFLAGQVNGTTGYEEAAGQGIIAGINAASLVLGRSPTVLRRDEAMIGVLIDDLVTRGVDEPYRLFTSRAEYRLLLRQDNALRRLLPHAERLGTLPERELEAASHRLEREEDIRRHADQTAAAPEAVNDLLSKAGGRGVTEPVRLSELARRPGVALAELLACTGFNGANEDATWAEVELKYEGYLDREREAVTRLRSMADFPLPAELPYHCFGSISFEAREKFARLAPEDLGRAGRIPGVTPNDIQNLVTEVLKWRRNRESCLA
jgi:tRNA uridine 5-carboxymethylaminomethyl modification enzyme